jgi:LmbE family N-acetylglucosaminyl deacetylase
VQTFKTRLKKSLIAALRKIHCDNAARAVFLLIKNAQTNLCYVGGVAFYAIPDHLRYKKVVRQKANRIMIVSHPDDESLFFSSELLHGDKKITVFCLTNGYDRVRRKEFYRAIAYYGVNGYIMKIPDRNAFSFLFNDRTIVRALRKLKRFYPCCARVYTHNPEGEYGHRHHQITSRNVANVFKESKVMVPLSFEKLGDERFRLPKQDLQIKQYVFDTFYQSQVEEIEKNATIWFSHEKTAVHS